jgi:hypothetical protein
MKSPTRLSASPNVVVETRVAEVGRGLPDSWYWRATTGPFPEKTSSVCPFQAQCAFSQPLTVAPAGSSGTFVYAPEEASLKYAHGRQENCSR